MKRILLLDDSPTIQRVVTLSFASTKGYEVKSASNLEAAKKCLAEGRPDVLIAYVRFSGDASPEFFKTLGVPTEQILLLAESRENLEPFEQAGLTQFVRKPFHTDELKKAILTIIGDDSIPVEHISTPTLNKAPPPPAFRPATTISMEALEKTFNRQTEVPRAAQPPPAPPRTATVPFAPQPQPPPPPRAPLNLPPPPPMPSSGGSYNTYEESALETQMRRTPPPPPPPMRESQQFAQHDADTQMRRTPPPPPPPPSMQRRETQVQPLVTRSEPRHFHVPPPPPLPQYSTNAQGNQAVEDLPDEHTESTPNPPQASQPQAAFNMAQATFADADARREVREWIARELPRIARDVVREELQKLLK